MKKINSFFIRVSVIGVMILFCIYFNGCSKIENLSDASTKIYIQDITGKDLQGSVSHTVFSDVITNNTVVNDNGLITVGSMPLDPDSIGKTTPYQDVIVDQIDVEFSRSDGLNVQGVNVPYSFSQKFSTLITTGDKPSAIEFVLITHNAKLEPPLVDLTNYGAEHILKLEAKITVHAVEVSGKRLSPVSGYISVWCANFADPTS